MSLRYVGYDTKAVQYSNSIQHSKLVRNTKSCLLFVDIHMVFLRDLYLHRYYLLSIELIFLKVLFLNTP